MCVCVCIHTYIYTYIHTNIHTAKSRAPLEHGTCTGLFCNARYRVSLTGATQTMFLGGGGGVGGDDHRFSFIVGRVGIVPRF